MVPKRLVGAQASVRKYDLLTALAVAGLAGPPRFCVSMTRLIALITARYNWRFDEVSIGQVELARLWSVDIRTVKREIKRLRETDVILVKRPAARGRVAAYSLNHARIDSLTAEVWPKVGADYAGRMGQGAQTRDVGNVVAFPSADDASPWGGICRRLESTDPARFQAWFAPLKREREEGDVLVVRAPSGFHADYVAKHLIGDLVRAVQSFLPHIREVRLETA